MKPRTRPWLEGLHGYDPNRVSATETDDPDAVSDEDLAAMEAAEGTGVLDIGIVEGE